MDIFSYIKSLKIEEQVRKEILEFITEILNGEKNIYFYLCFLKYYLLNCRIKNKFKRNIIKIITGEVGQKQKESGAESVETKI